MLFLWWFCFFWLIWAYSTDYFRLWESTFKRVYWLTYKILHKCSKINFCRRFILWSKICVMPGTPLVDWASGKTMVRGFQLYPSHVAVRVLSHRERLYWFGHFFVLLFHFFTLRKSSVVHFQNGSTSIFSVASVNYRDSVTRFLTVRFLYQLQLQYNWFMWSIKIWYKCPF